MRIARMIDELGWNVPQTGWGGAEKAQLVFATEVKRRAMDLTIISLRENDTPIVDGIRALGVPVVVLPFRRLFDPVWIPRTIRFFKRQRFDVVQTHLTYANIIGAFVGRVTGTPIVATLHNEKPDLPGSRQHAVRDRLEMLVLRHGAQRVVAVGHVVARAYQQRLGGCNLAVIPNAVEDIPPISPAERATLRCEVVGDETRPILIAIGRLSPQKGFDDLLTAFAAVREQHPAAALIIAGNGPLYDDLLAQRDALNLHSHAFLLGHRKDILPLLRSCDMFVSSSHWEGTQRSMLEAMAAGLPVVATDVGDAARVVVAETGLVVPPRDHNALVNAICSLLRDPLRMQAMGAAAEAHIKQHYHAAGWVDQHLALYEEVLRTKGRGKGNL